MTHYCHLTEHAHWQLGLIPRGVVPPHLLGLAYEKPSQYGAMYRIETPWRWAIVHDCWKGWG